jgi:predicted signal transduction protein with EAL and GGDEF domain
MKNVKMENRIRKAMTMVITFQFVLTMAMTSYASDYAKNGVMWFLDQAFWFVIGVMAFCAITAYVKHATAAMVTSIVVGGIVAFLCKNPESVIKIGDALGRAVMGG